MYIAPRYSRPGKWRFAARLRSPCSSLQKRKLMQFPIANSWERSSAESRTFQNKSSSHAALEKDYATRCVAMCSAIRAT
jgi:hypothetical protein